MNPQQEDGSLWHEPWHQDGGGSVLHLGLTLYGNRTCKFLEKDASPPGDRERLMIIHNQPGTVYMGQVTGAEHGVEHAPTHDDDLLLIPGSE